jgi:hypothetical protein
MTNIEAGLFTAMLAVAFGLMFIAFRMGYPTSVLTRMGSMGIFMGLMVVMVSGFGVVASSSTTNTATGDTWNNSDTWILAGGSGAWLGYIFLAFSILNFFWLVKEVWEA